MNPLIENPIAYYEKLFKRLRIALEYTKFHRALDCLNFAAEYHTGLRKDNVTPEFLHQVEQALYALTVQDLLQYPEDTICAIILHDTVEDYFDQGVRHAHVYDLAGERVSIAVQRLTNHIDNIKKPDEIYYRDMALDAIASFAKAGDWAHNLGSMPGVFESEKIREKLDKANMHLFPMIKTARIRFHRQANAYYNVQTILVQQVRMLEHLIASGYKV